MWLLQECASLVRSCHVQLHAFLACAAAALRKGVRAVAVAVAVAVNIVVVIVVFIVVVVAGEYSKLLLIDLFFSQAAIRWPSAMKLQIEIHLQSQLLWQLLLLLPLPVADTLSAGGYLQQMQVKMIYCSIRLLHSQGSPNILDESFMIYAPARRQLVGCGLCLC